MELLVNILVLEFWVGVLVLCVEVVSRFIRAPRQRERRHQEMLDAIRRANRDGQH